MAQEFDKIISLLEEIKTLNTTNNNSTSKLLESIKSKISFLNNKGGSSLCKSYYDELIKSLESLFGTTSTVFQTNETALREIYNERQEELTDKKENSENILSKNIHDFYNLESEAKNSLKKIKSSITSLKKSKNAETTIEEINSNVSDLVRNYEKITNESFKDLEILFSDLNKNNWKKKNHIKKHIDSIQKGLKSLIDTYSHESAKHNTLENLLLNVITGENLKITQSAISTVAEKIDDLYKQITTKNTKKGEKENVAELKQLTKQTEELVSKTNNIKQALGEITQNIDSLPNMNFLEDSIQEFYIRLEKLTKDFAHSTAKVNIYDISSRITFLKEDFATIKNIVKDLNDVLSSKLKSSLKSVSADKSVETVKEQITKIISSLPRKEDIKKILTDKKLEEKEAIDEFKEKTDELTQRIDNLPETTNEEKITEIPSSLNIVETKIDSAKLDKEFDNIYRNNAHMDNWLVNSEIKPQNENDNTTAEIQDKPANEDISNILKTTEQIVGKLESITNNTKNESVQVVESSSTEDIKDQLDFLRVEILNTQNIQKDELLSKIAELETNVENSVTAQDFINFTEELQDVLNLLVSKSESTDLVDYKNEILKRIDNIDFSEITNTFTKDLNTIEDLLKSSQEDRKEISSKLISMSESMKDEIINKIDNLDFSKISEYVNSNSIENTEDIKNELTDLKELIANKRSDFSELNKQNNDIISSVGEYFDEIKKIILGFDIKPDEETMQKLENIESDISEYRTYNEDKFEQISDKIDEYEKSIDEKYTLNTELLTSISEISELKEQIANLRSSFDSLNFEKNDEKAITEFVSSRLNELNGNLDELCEDIKNGVQQGFTYNSELIEEKTNALLEVIKELRHASTNNIELFERLTVTDNRLMDFQQELELVNTDVKNLLNSKTESIIEGLEEIKNIIKENTTSQTDLEEIKKLIKNTNSITKSAIPIPEIASSETIENYEKFDELYKDITQKIEETENNIRDFILGDIDSVIIKVDNIKDYLSERLESSIPPDTEQMSDLNNFVSQIAKFKEENEKYFQQIETSIENVSSQNEDIITAIEGLRKVLNAKIKKINSGDDTEVLSDPIMIEDFRADLEKYSDKIEALSGQNTDIEYILNDISKKFDNITQDGSISGEELSETINTNIEKLLDKVKEDWLKEVSKHGGNENINALMKEINDKIDILALSADLDDTAGNDEIKQLLTGLNSKIDIIASNDNLDSFDGITKLLNILNSKIDVIASQDNMDNLEGIKESIDNIFLNNYSKDDQNNELKELLQTLNNKIDIIAQSDPSEKIDSLSDSDVQITSMLETLNHKIDIIADSNNADYDNEDNFDEIRNLILEQKDFIAKLEPSSKLDAFKKCLEELTNEVNGISSNIENGDMQKTLKDMKESIMEAVVSIFNQVSFVEETEDIKDFVEEKTDKIARDLEEVTKQIKQIASSDESDDYTYSMQDIETDLAKLRIALNDLQNNALNNNNNYNDIGIEAIADSLNRITSSVDLLTQDEIQDLKTDITNLKEQTQHLLLSSDASFTTLNTDILGKVDNVTQLLEKSNDSDKVMRQALIYMGEWIDSASQSMNRISSNSEDIKDEVENLKSYLPEHKEFLDSIEDKFEQQEKHLVEFEKQISRIEDIEAKFEEQEERIDRLEMNLEKILSLVEDIDNNGIAKKIDKIDKQLAKLSTNIEKLTSYVD